jgi:glycosyltransferase involved in cell wall biosynthesis
MNSTLTIVIPALNEEAAIGDTIQRCLDSVEYVREAGGVGGVEIIVVSDGSTDRTEEIARSFAGVNVAVFAKNRGYGAAIKCGFELGSGDLLGFLDADGTCDPRMFAELCKAIHGGADIALGSRLGSGSGMPAIRYFGNKVFAWMLGVLSKRVVGDTASGMRVIRRDRLKDLYPLPDGLHFTPAMSARVLLENKLVLVEVPMPYAERVGQSKLSVARDGFRFLDAIARAAVCYRPGRILLLAVGVLALAAVVVAFSPVAFYLRFHRLEEWMIYRVALAFLLATVGAQVFCAAMVAQKVAASFYQRSAGAGIGDLLLRTVFSTRTRWVASAVLMATAILVAWPGIVQYVSTGTVDMHWSRVLLSSLLVIMVAVISVTSFLLGMVDLMDLQRSTRSRVGVPDRFFRSGGEGVTSSNR